METKTVSENPTLSTSDAEVFGGLYSLYWKDMYRFALFYMKNREEAEDAVQEAALQAYRGIGGLKDPDAFKNWIFTILLRTCRRRMRGLIKQRQSVEIVEISEKAGMEPDSFVTVELREKIDCLDDRERRMIWLSVTAGYKSREIAEIMNLSDGAVRSALSRALAKLRTHLDDNT